MKALILMQSMGWDGMPRHEAKTVFEGEEKAARHQMAEILNEARIGGAIFKRMQTPGWKPGTARRWGVNAGAGGLTEFVLLRFESEGA